MYRLEPWGDDWLQTAKIEAAIMNAFANANVCPTELIPNEDNRPPPQEVEDATLNQRWKTRLRF